MICKKTAIFCLCAAAMLSGCNGQANSPENDTSAVTDVFGNEFIESDENYDKEQDTYNCTEYIYMVLSDGEAVNSYDNPEAFADERIDAKIADKSEYFKAEIGYTVDGLTLTETESKFGYGHLYTGTPVISYAKFDGTITVKGYVTVNAYEPNENIEKGKEITFFPSDGEWKGLPMIWGEFKTLWRRGDFEIRSNAPMLSLGNVDNYTVDLSTIPRNGSLAQVEIVLDRLVLRWSDGDYGGSINTAEIVSIKALSDRPTIEPNMEI